MDRKSVILHAVKKYGLDFNYDLTSYDDEELERVKKIKTDLKKNLLPKIKQGIAETIPLIKDFAVCFANCGKDTLGMYINGSYVWKPIILIDLDNTIKNGNEFNVGYDVVIETTILHELAHAIQDILGVDFDELQAENFAVNYHYYGEVLDLREKVLI